MSVPTERPTEAFWHEPAAKTTSPHAVAADDVTNSEIDDAPRRQPVVAARGDRRNRRTIRVPSHGRDVALCSQAHAARHIPCVSGGVVDLRRSINLIMVTVATAAVILAVRLGAAEPGNSYRVQNLVSDGFITTAQPPDPLLVNGWGIAALPTSPWWVSAADSNSSLLYNATGVRSALVVQVP